jgi:ABC-2 type transport system ATP-binding protein
MLNSIGFLPEERGLYRGMTALDSVTYFGRLKGMRRLEARAAAAGLLEQVGLGGRFNVRIDALSKGLAQKVQLAAALVNQPRLVLLDEPFSGLDPVNQSVLEELIVDLARRGATVLFSTHVMQHAERLCDRLLLLAEGRKIFDGTPAVAQRLIPGRLRMTAMRDPSSLRGIKRAVRGETVDGWSDWEVELARGIEPGEVLQACFQQGIELKDFEIFRPRLHDIFVHLVGRNGLGLST